MAETLKIDDLPAELLERFAPDLLPQTVSELRLVNRRFGDVFCADRFYRGYVRHGGAGGGEPADGGGGPWRRRLEAEKRSLENWRNGRAVRAETVAIPAEELKMLRQCGDILWQGVVGQRGDHWMLSELVRNAKIALARATGAPVLAVLDVSSHTQKPVEFAFLLPDQVLIDGGGTGHVFNIVNLGESLSLEHFFTIDQFQGGLCTSGTSASGAFRSLYLSITNENDAVLRRFDLKTAVRLDDLALPDLLPTDAFDFDVAWRVNAMKIEHPLVLVTIDFDLNEGLLRSGKRVYTIVNAEAGSLEFWCREDRASYVELCAFTGDAFLLNLFTGNHFHLRWFDRSSLQSDLRKSAVLYQHRAHNYFHVHFNSSTLVLSITQEIPGDPIIKIIVASLIGTEVVKRDIDVDAMSYTGRESRSRPIVDCSLVGPFLVVRGDHCLLSLDVTGEILFDWQELLRGLGVSMRHESLRITDEDVEFNSISKCVLQNDRGDRLIICYF